MKVTKNGAIEVLNHVFAVFSPHPPKKSHLPIPKCIQLIFGFLIRSMNIPVHQFHQFGLLEMLLIG